MLLYEVGSFFVDQVVYYLAFVCVCVCGGGGGGGGVCVIYRLIHAFTHAGILPSQYSHIIQFAHIGDWEMVYPFK